MTDYSSRDPSRNRPQDFGKRPDNGIEIMALWQGVRRFLPLIFAVMVVLGVLVFFWSRSRPDVYQASSSMVTTGNNSSIGNLRDSLVTAAPLPDGALQEALQGPVVMKEIILKVKAASSLTEQDRKDISSDLQQELQRREIRTVQLDSRLDFAGSGIYTVTAEGPTPEAAALLADVTAQALLNWDRGRALAGVERAQKSLRAQLNEIDRQLAEGNLTDLERQTLLTSRANLQRNLAQAGIQAEGATGSLELVAPAVVPIDRTSPKPTRNALLVALLTLLLGSGIAALRTVFDRTARSEDDLLVFGLPTMGIIPRLRKRDVVFNGIVRAARKAGLYEAIGFLRVNIQTRIGNRKRQRIMISSTAPGEGKSSLTATLADGLAASGQMVLIIDADMRRGTQQEVWEKYEREHAWHQLVGQGGARTLQDALRDPQNVQVMEAEPNVHVLPAGPGMHDSLGLLNRAPLGEYFDQWSHAYDIVLVDSPPLLALADGLILGKHVDHVLLVVEEGKTSLQAIRQSVRRAQNAQISLLGFILNKVAVNSQEGRNYGYSYGYNSEGKD